jgi:hypothetical protein
MQRYLRVGYAHYINEDNAVEYGIADEFSKKTAIAGMQARAKALGATTNKSPEWHGDMLFFTLYLHFDVTSYPKDWSASDFAQAYDFGTCNPIHDDDTQIKSVKIVKELPAGCKLGDMDEYVADED